MSIPALSRYFELLWSVVMLIADSLCLAFSNLIPNSLKRKKDISNEVVLITGGGSGFGQLMSVKFANLGCRVVIWDLGDEQCMETVAKVEREVPGAHKVRYYVVDVSKRLRVYETAEKVKKDVGEVTILVNNAGIAQDTFFLDTSDYLLEKMMNVNAMAHFWTLKAFLPSMMAKNHGHLVTIASMSSLMSSIKLSAYTASKHAALGFTDSITMELIECGKTNVKTTTVCPWLTKTPISVYEYDGIAPRLEAEYVVDKIMEGVLTNQPMVYVPYSSGLSSFFSRLTTKAAFLRMGKCLSGEAILKTGKARIIAFDD